MTSLIPKTLIILTIILSITNCSTKQTIIKKTNSIDTNVFSRNKSHNKSSQLRIRTTLKEHPVGYFLTESKKSHHGKKNHKFLINIDGQAVSWQVKGRKEKINDKIISSSYMSYKNFTAESGEGVRYDLDKKIWLTPGRHRVFFAIPNDNFYIEFSINVDGEKSNLLNLKPIYRKAGRSSSSRNFKKGVSSYKIIFNGKEIN